MIIALDTTILIELERRNRSITEKLKELAVQYPEPAHITFISYFEFLRGLTDKKPKNKEKALAFLNEFNLLLPTKKTAFILSELKAKYDRKGFSVPLADMLIAAQVIENNLLLVTKDNDFDKIEEMKKIVLA